MTDGEPIDWVMGQVDYREENVWFGAHNENHGLTTWAYEDGTRGLAMTGEGSDFVSCYPPPRERGLHRDRPGRRPAALTSPKQRVNADRHEPREHPQSMAESARARSKSPRREAPVCRTRYRPERDLYRARNR